ncbi:MAG TPA: helical backbone metal receptor [Thermoanaerobaculia bacterium]|nr:helical backbone metal receptor [Thermoanaerobaculia bacterium]
MLIDDIRGKRLTFEHPPSRVVSLVPSLTETLFDLGAGSSVVGITDFCLFPERGLAGIPRLGGTKNPRIDAIRALGPDLVYMNLEENLPRHGAEIEQFAPLHVSEPKSVAGVRDLILDLGVLHEVEERARHLADALDEEAAMKIRTTPFTFVCAIWKKPWMWCGGDTYVSNLVETVGGVNFLQSHRRYPAIDPEAIAALHPEVVFLPDEPYGFTEADAALLASATSSRVIGPFPGHLFTWHGTRTILGLRFLREVLG